MDPRDVANRDLLIGLLALQNGLIDQDVLVSAFRAWTRDKSTPIAEILQGRGAIEAEERVLLEQLAANHVKRHGGDVEKSLAAMEVDRSTQESLARIGDADIGATIVHVGSGSGPTESDRTTTFQVGPASEDGRFRVLRPYARGGLGAVFVALDAELNREVALKQILDGHADDPMSRTRFVLEAEITGGLEHPGIVPVYGLGSDGSGRPYYAMRFIRGESLKEAIAGFHDDPALKADAGKRSLALRRLLRRFVDVCNAIEYAISRGVLHRDIKPANIIVGKHGETLVVDWGLAKLMGKVDASSNLEERTLIPSSASGSAETLPGSALGTPAYMSPEQARGDLDRLGPRSEVYSLGATLYCLLTGRPPFEGPDVGSVLRAVEKGDFRPPRAINPTIDRALEAVCMKAMALDPDGRYASPKAFADDVERWGADEPVVARREPTLARVGRWAKRHRTAVAAVGLSLATAVVLLTISNVQVRAAQRETARALERADLNFQRARQAVEDSFTIVSEDLLLEEPGMQPLREKLLQSALKYHQAFLRERADDPSVEAEVAGSRWRFGSIAFELGQRKEARSQFEEAAKHLEKLAASHPNRPELRRKYAQVLAHIGWTHATEQGGNKAAVEAYRKAASTYEGLLLKNPSDPEAREGLAWTLGLLGQKRAEMRGGSEEAGEVLKRAKELRRSLVAEFPGSLRHRKKLVELNGLLYSRYIGNSARQKEAIESSTEARAALQEMLRLAPRSQNLRFMLAQNMYLRASMHLRQEEPDKSVVELRPAVQLFSDLVEANPDVPKYGQSLANAKSMLGDCLTKTNEFEAALGPLQEAAELHKRILAADGRQIQNEKEYQSTLTRLGSTLLLLRRFDEAIPSLRTCLELSEDLVRRDPTDIFAKGTSLVIRGNLAITLSRAGRHVEAVEMHERAREFAKEAFGDPDWGHEGRNPVTDGLIRAYSLREVGRVREAEEIVERSRADAANDAYSSFELARYDARGASLLERSGGRADRVHTLEERAFEGLRHAGRIGYLPPEHVAQNDAFDSLRARDGYRLLLLDLAFPANPFVGGVEPVK